MASLSPPDRRVAMPVVVGYLRLSRHAATAAVSEVWPALLDALGAHSPVIEPDPPAGCWLDLRSGRRGPSPLTTGAAVLATACDWGYAEARLGIAPTPGVARLAAWEGVVPLLSLAPPEVAAFLAPLPVRATGLPSDLADRLALVGLHSLGDLAALPRGALGDYLGPAGPALEALARGEDDRPLLPLRAPLTLTTRRELDWALDDRAQLATIVLGLLRPPLATLRRQGLGATRATLTLSGERGAVSATARTAQPTTDSDLLVRLLFAALPGDSAGEHAAGGITAVAVLLVSPRPLAGRQASFFDVPQGRRGLVTIGVAETQRRAQGDLGYLHPVDLAHPLPEHRYRFVAVGDAGELAHREGT